MHREFMEEALAKFREKAIGDEIDRNAIIV